MTSRRFRPNAIASVPWPRRPLPCLPSSPIPAARHSLPCSLYSRRSVARRPILGPRPRQPLIQASSLGSAGVLSWIVLRQRRWGRRAWSTARVRDVGIWASPAAGRARQCAGIQPQAVCGSPEAREPRLPPPSTKVPSLHELTPSPHKMEWCSASAGRGGGVAMEFPVDPVCRIRVGSNPLECAPRASNCEAKPVQLKLKDQNPRWPIGAALLPHLWITDMGHDLPKRRARTSS